MLLIKPNITLIPATGIGIWLVRRRNWRAIWMMLSVLIVLFSISTWITPNWYQPLFEEGYIQGLNVALDGPGQVLAIRINTTFLDWLRTLHIASPWNTLFYAIAICAGVIVFFGSVLRSQSIVELVSILLLVSYAITPYALQYDYPSLAIPLFWALSRCAGSSKVFSIGLLLAGFVFSVIFWQENISWSYWMLVGTIALAIWSSLASKNYSDKPTRISNNP